MNHSSGITEFVAVGGALIIALLLAWANRRVSSPTERMKMRAAAWSLLSETPAELHDIRTRAPGNDSEKENA